jgi:hypothetical protein
LSAITAAESRTVAVSVTNGSPGASGGSTAEATLSRTCGAGFGGLGVCHTVTSAASVSNPLSSVAAVFNAVTRIVVCASRRSRTLTAFPAGTLTVVPPSGPVLPSETVTSSPVAPFTSAETSTESFSDDSF